MTAKPSDATADLRRILAGALHDGARDPLEQYLIAGSNLPGPRLNLALVYEQNGDAETAERLRADARALDPHLEAH